MADEEKAAQPIIGGLNVFAKKQQAVADLSQNNPQYAQTEEDLPF